MKLEILGSGGAITTPKPFCNCTVCELARAGSAQDARLGPSVFIHGPNLLIDTPEEISIQLNRSSIEQIDGCVYSHWHPDHTAGKRVFEMNKDWIGLPPENRKTQIFLTEKVESTFQQFLGLKGYFDFLASDGLVDISIVKNSEPFLLNGYRITPVQMKLDFSFGFTIEGGNKKILVVMDELKAWVPNEVIGNTEFDLVYLPLGIVEVNPINGKRNVDPKHPILQYELTLNETIDTIKMLKGKKFILSHIEELDGVSCSMGQQLGRYCSEQTGKKVELGYDTLICDI
ncbi:MAG: MBL fold metallo-hydrolase [Desulfoprunum sp.]|uniref:MBL fold metallo-hydrolase n=1 Tax=Desulfoprunum sp. TaxID=2020866 RepID=UPI00269BE5FB